MYTVTKIMSRYYVFSCFTPLFDLKIRLIDTQLIKKKMIFHTIIVKYILFCI